MTGLQNIRSRRAFQGQDKQSVVFPWCFDAWGTGGRRRTQLAGGQAPLSATHSVTRSAGAINVSKKKKCAHGTTSWKGRGSQRSRSAGLKGEDCRELHRTHTNASMYFSETRILCFSAQNAENKERNSIKVVFSLML